MSNCRVELLVMLSKSFHAESLELHRRQVEHPELGKKYYFNLRANVMSDIARAIEGALTKNELA